ncbi:MAG: dephospho-CoA kinase [Saprospiraceae bacterium]
MLHIGITGGIGSGKTTVCKIFATLGIPIYYADDRAKALMVEDKDLVKQITDIFGEAAYLSDGQLNRGHIAQIAFSDADKLAQLNAAVHPAVGKDTLKWQQEQSGVPYTLREAALLFESGGYKNLDQVITVFAEQEIRLARVLKRDNTTREAVLARMNKQMPEAEKLKLADFVIQNNGTESLIQQVWNIHQELTRNSFTNNE